MKKEEEEEEERERENQRKEGEIIAKLSEDASV